MKKLFSTLLFIYVCSLVYAQTEEKVNNVFQGTRFINGQSANLADKGELMVLIQHRFGSIDGGLYELFGLDQASMRLGFEYGFGDNFNLGIGRSTYMKTYDLFGKYKVLQQTNEFPVTLVITGAGSVPTLRDYFPDVYDNFSDKLSLNGQVHIARTFNNIGIQLSPGIMQTGYLLSENEKLSFFTLGMGGSLKLGEKVSGNVEYLHRFASEIDLQKTFSLGVDIDTGGHLFQLIVSNSQRMFDQAIYSHSNGDWTEGVIFFGFNLIREFDINKPIEF
jgi:hypothetical protein